VQDTPPVARPSSLGQALKERREAQEHHALDRPPGPFRLSHPLDQEGEPELERERRPIGSDYFLG
jgi:hypothetical protein